MYTYCGARERFRERDRGKGQKGVAYSRYDVVVARQMRFAFVAAKDLVGGEVGIVDETHVGWV